MCIIPVYCEHLYYTCVLYMCIMNMCIIHCIVNMYYTLYCEHLNYTCVLWTCVLYIVLILWTCVLYIVLWTCVLYMCNVNMCVVFSYTSFFLLFILRLKIKEIPHLDTIIHLHHLWSLDLGIFTYLPVSSQTD